MDTLQPQKNTRKKSATGLDERLADNRIVGLKNSLYSIRDTAKELQKKKPELLLFEAMSIAWKEYAAKDELSSHIENFKKIGQVKIPGTSIPLPLFDFDDPHVCVWLNERLLQLKKTNSKLTYRTFLEMIARKTEHYEGRASHIAGEEFLLISEGKIIAMAPDLWELEEFNWDDLDNQKWAEERERENRKKWLKEQGLTEKDYEERLKSVRENLKKAQIHK